MKPVLRWLAIGVAGLVALVVLAAGGLYGLSGMRLNRRHPVDVAPIAVPKDSAAIARGAHIARAISSCVECHGEDLAGTIMIDQPSFAVLSAPNITSAGLGAQLSDRDFVRAIRYGVAPDGRSLVVMPSQDYYYLSDADLGAVIAWVRSVPGARRELKPTRFGPISRALLVTGKFPILQAELINPQAPRSSPEPGVTVVYGAYLAKIGGCTDCHGPGLSGGLMPDAPPDAPPARNLTPEGLGKWSDADFTRALREGKRPDGTTLNPFMPYRNLRNMTDQEIAALWVYLKSVPPKPYGGR